MSSLFFDSNIGTKADFSLIVRLESSLEGTQKDKEKARN